MRGNLQREFGLNNCEEIIFSLSPCISMKSNSLDFLKSPHCLISVPLAFFILSNSPFVDDNSIFFAESKKSYGF